MKIAMVYFDSTVYVNRQGAALISTSWMENDLRCCLTVFNCVRMGLAGSGHTGKV